MTDERYELMLLQEILSGQKEIRKEQVKQGKDIASLKVKAGIWGTLGGTIATATYVLAAWVKGVVRG